MGMDALQGGPNPGLSGPRGNAMAGAGDPASLMERLRPLIAQRLQQQQTQNPVAQQMPAQVPNPAGAQDPTAMTMPGVAQKPQFQGSGGIIAQPPGRPGEVSPGPAGMGWGGQEVSSMSVEPAIAQKPAWQGLAEMGVGGQGSPAANQAMLAKLQAQKAGGSPSGGIVADGVGGPSSAGGAAPVGGIQQLRQKVLDAAGAGAIARDARPGVMTKPAVRGGPALRRRVVQ